MNRLRGMPKAAARVSILATKSLGRGMLTSVWSAERFLSHLGIRRDRTVMVKAVDGLEIAVSARFGG